jgi:dGTPase
LIIPGVYRSERQFQATPEDQRTSFARDRDRILYSSAFRRLAGVTQIVRAGEADVFHTRLAHTLKVAQVGRRLAEYVLATQPAQVFTLGVHPEVVEAACLAHDIGHPPFGHTGEWTLNRLVTDEGNGDGFEGNAQSFRILTKLAVRFESHDGLDLTRATLAACIKYPWRRHKRHKLKSKKWGYYASEEEEFKFARLNSREETKTAEAELMDWADDIAYSVHDLEDFHRCYLIPWQTVFGAEGRNKLVEGVLASRIQKRPGDRANLTSAHIRLSQLVDGTVGDVINEPYEGTREQRRAIRLMTSTLIGRYVRSVSLVVLPVGQTCLATPDTIKAEIDILKQITRQYIIARPALRAQQRGQEKILEDLFDDLITKNSEKYLPSRIAYLLEGRSGRRARARSVADCICSLTEAEAIALHRRLRGQDSGSVLDPIVR